jgi:hypothetical protein
MFSGFDYALIAGMSVAEWRRRIGEEMMIEEAKARGIG